MKERILLRIKGRPFLPLGDDIYYEELEYFANSLLNSEKPQPDVNDWLKVAEIIDTVYSTNTVKPEIIENL
jgi:hypothetical protein